MTKIEIGKEKVKKYTLMMINFQYTKIERKKIPQLRKRSSECKYNQKLLI